MTQWRKIERDTRDTLGEGVMWSARDNAIYWVDILSPALNRLSLADGGVERWTMPEPLGWVVENGSGQLVGGFQSGLGRISLDRMAVTHIADPEPDLQGNRMNDGKADRDGAIWCGTMDMAEEHARGSLYRLLWVAHWEGGRISRFAPDGRFDRAIALPARRVTNVTFAGKGLDRMFVTSAAKGLPKSEFDGALFEVASGAVGLAPGIYGGSLDASVRSK